MSTFLLQSANQLSLEDKNLELVNDTRCFQHQCWVNLSTAVFKNILGNRKPRLPSITGMFTCKEERRDISRSRKVEQI